jgi:hypothetical protein
MARALDEAWKTCDVAIKDSFQQTRDEDRQCFKITNKPHQLPKKKGV